MINILICFIVGILLCFPLSKRPGLGADIQMYLSPEGNHFSLVNFTLIKMMLDFNNHGDDIVLFLRSINVMNYTNFLNIEYREGFAFLK